jgi:hypothetical protein
MSFQTNFRAQDMLGVAKPVVKKAAPKYVAPAVKAEPVFVEKPVVKDVVEDVVVEAEETSTEE